MITEQNDATGKLITAAEKYAEDYEGEEKTNVLNAFYRGYEFSQNTEQNGQIIVDELRPMSEAPDFDHKEGKVRPILALCKSDNEFYRIFADMNTETPRTWLRGKHEKQRDRHFHGWIPMPIYKPKKIDPFHQKGPAGRLIEVSGLEEVRELARLAADNTRKLMQTKEG